MSRGPELGAQRQASKVHRWSNACDVSKATLGTLSGLQPGYPVLRLGNKIKSALLFWRRSDLSFFLFFFFSDLLLIFLCM